MYNEAEVMLAPAATEPAAGDEAPNGSGKEEGGESKRKDKLSRPKPSATTFTGMDCLSALMRHELCKTQHMQRLA
jgi:hypothetical protein